MLGFPSVLSRKCPREPKKLLAVTHSAAAHAVSAEDWAIKTRKKETHLSRAAKPRKGRSDRGIFGAVAKGCLSEIEKTLKDNDINALNSSRETLLHVAAANGHLAVMEYLISRGAKPDVKDKKGRTPLHRAAEKGHGDAVKVLLRCGASMYSLDTEGKMPLHVAAQNSHGHVLTVLLREEARSYRNQHNFLHRAALKDESSLVERLLKSGASVDGKDERGQTALSYALSQGFENTAKVLLEAGARVDSSMAERAFNSNNPSIFKVLLEYSKDLINLKTDKVSVQREVLSMVSTPKKKNSVVEAGYLVYSK
uniref:Uncharacterized protein n=1 Tax=Anas platyrhynchos platyrhynchos TaxID=8840 RepID=A0A493TTK3_ANAPP